MLEKLRILSLKLEETREEMRKLLSKGEKAEARALMEEVDKLEAEMLLITSNGLRRKTARLLQLKFIDGMPPGQIQFILNISHSTYYRLLKEAERS